MKAQLTAVDALLGKIVAYGKCEFISSLIREAIWLKNHVLIADASVAVDTRASKMNENIS